MGSKSGIPQYVSIIHELSVEESARDTYIQELGPVLYRARHVGYQITDLKTTEHLRDTIRAVLRDQSPTIFYDLLEMDSCDGEVIDYHQYKYQLVRTWRRRLDMQARAR